MPFEPHRTRLVPESILKGLGGEARGVGQFVIRRCKPAGKQVQPVEAATM
jgi:hypothetical protein